MNKLFDKWAKLNVKEYIAISSIISLTIFILSIAIIGYSFEGVVAYIGIVLFLITTGSFVIYKLDKYEKKQKERSDRTP